jgi:hypothetical protein
VAVADAVPVGPVLIAKVGSGGSDDVADYLSGERADLEPGVQHVRGDQLDHEANGANNTKLSHFVYEVPESRVKVLDE